jgi:hypothetical protein
MSRTRLLLVLAVLVLVAGVAVYFSTRGPAATAIDLVALFGDTTKAERRALRENAFATETVTIDGQAKPSILARPAARIIYTVAIPADAWLETSFALKPDVWQKPTDGVQFRIGVSDGRTYEEYLKELVNPKGRDRDRRWLSATIDLSAYEGQLVELNFNTDPGPPKDAGDSRNDFALWGEPRIIGH